jgi:hypothetical protein
MAGQIRYGSLQLCPYLMSLSRRVPPAREALMNARLLTFFLGNREEALRRDQLIAAQ